ncbi:hypothetical protein [Sphaerisporangium rhizosphaerae]|uniref:DUF3592 domain-containing protein n=1 Tax=Sphaerisporangium rhizosphaerae TaxID=2269375 RepID=A0ABW2P5H4_9ACTN
MIISNGMAYWGRYDGRARRFLRLTGAAALAIGLGVANGFLAAYGPTGWPAVLLAIAGFFVSMAPVAVVFFGMGTLLCLPVALLLAMSVWSAQGAVTDVVRADRGRVSDCTVLSERSESRTVSDYHPGTGPNDPGSWDTHTEVTYHYRLSCGGNGPGTMETGSSVAKPGSVIAVSWDPTGRLKPVPAREVSSSEEVRSAAMTAGAAELLLLADLFIGRGWLRRLRRRSRPIHRPPD